MCSTSFNIKLFVTIRFDLGRVELVCELNSNAFQIVYRNSIAYRIQILVFNCSETIKWTKYFATYTRTRQTE